MEDGDQAVTYRMFAIPRAARCTRNEARGFSIIELMIVVALVAVLAAVAYPSYRNYIIRTSREAAESQLQQLANLEEKIFLNSNAYTPRVTNAYTGASGGGLGLASGLTSDGKYSVSAAADAFTFTLTATPVTGTMQDGDGTLTINHLGDRIWNKAGSCKTWDNVAISCPS